MRTPSARNRLAFAALRLAVLSTPVAAHLSSPLAAQVVRIDVERREPFAGGRAFGEVGPYEKLVGSLWLEVDPHHPANDRITDLDLAPVNERGRVEVRTGFYLIKPVDPSRGNGNLLYDVHNRGNKVAMGSFNGAGGNDPEDAGTGFLMERGWSVLWTGWSGDVLPGDGRLTIDVPVATRNGEPITGKVYAEIESGGFQLYNNNFVTRTRAPADGTVHAIPFDWGGSRSYASVTRGNENATLSRRRSRDAEPIEIPRDRWWFGRVENGEVVPDSTHLYAQDGFRLGWLYDLVYVAEGPRVTGLGLAAVRDPVSFFRYADGKENPLAGAIDHAYGFGVSQSGRFLNHFVWEGMTVDTEGRPVFDGVLAEVPGAGKGLFNYRFWQTTRHGSQHEDNLYPSDVFPFTSTPSRDPVTGERGDMLERARAAGFVPKIMYLNTSSEYWNRAASLLHTDVTGTRDVPLDPNVRIYVVAGAPHNAMRGGHYDNPLNPASRAPVTRAMLVALDAWAAQGEAPPESAYPRIADGTLVPLETFREQFPDLPGVREPQVVYRPLRLDMGPRWETEGVADHVPPVPGERFVTLVPAVDGDGNEVAGIRLPHVAVPVATYTGWNLRAPKWGASGMLTRWMGSYFELPRTAADAEAAGDPRRPILARYPSRDAYVRAVEAAVRELEADRYVLPADGARLVEEARERGYWQ